MFGSLSEGTTTIHGFLKGADCLSTIDCFRKMGISIEEKDETIYVHGKGLHGLSKPEETLDVGNSGTTTRLISGILAGQDFDTVLSGDASLNSRPMGRIMKPLSMMGADVTSINNNGCAPLSIKGHTLNAIHYDSPVASAQVKSCVLLAGLYAEGKTSVTEPALSRDRHRKNAPFLWCRYRIGWKHLYHHSARDITWTAYRSSRRHFFCCIFHRSWFNHSRF